MKWLQVQIYTFVWPPTSRQPQAAFAVILALDLVLTPSMRFILLANSVFVAIKSAQGLNADFPGLIAGRAPADDPRFTSWQAPGPNDVRSPCQ